MSDAVEFPVKTTRKIERRDITGEVTKAAAKLDVASGALLVSLPHTTAAVTINENADPHVATDLLRAYVDLLGDEQRFQHAEGNSGGHALTSLVGPSVTIPIQDGQMSLGQWQAVYFCEFDGPRQRTLRVQVIGSGV